MLPSIGELLRDEHLPGRDFSKATAHEIAGIIIGQLERMNRLLTRQHAEYPPIADTRAYTASTPIQIYVATRREYIRLMALSASAACNITLSIVHPTTGPQKWPVFVLQAVAAGPLAIGEHEFTLPADGQLWAMTDANASLSITASVFEGTVPGLMMNWEM